MKIQIGLIIFIFAFILGYLLCDYQQGKNYTTKTITLTETDTVFVQVVDSVHVVKTEIIHQQIRDTVLMETFKPIISHFKTSKPFLYGNTTVSGEVFGEVLKMDIVNDFKIPTVTNTITTTNTIVKNPSGLFLTGGINSNFSNIYRPYIGAVYVKNKILVGLNTSGFQVGYKVH